VLVDDKICAVVAASKASEMQRQLSQAVRHTHTVEVRLDWLRSEVEIDRFVGQLGRHAARPVTFIATCRRTKAGGRYRGSIGKQLLHLAEAIRAGCTWYDLEIETIRECPPELLEALLGDGRQLRSAHYFRHLPGNLSLVAQELKRGDPQAIKIAAHCDSLAEANKLAEFASRHRNVIAIPMGEVALPARILALRAKNGFAYAPVENATAAGQTSLAELSKLYRADRINRQTRVYGVIGNPISHSLSPAMHNRAFAARRINAIYLPFLVGDLRDFLDSVDRLGIDGFSVTLPHKETIMKYLDGCDPLAARIGAVNTVTVRGPGHLYGYNTDYVGVLRTLERRVRLPASRVLVLGAGGAARAVAFALAQAGSRVCVSARRWDKAKALAGAVDGEAIERAKLRGEFFDAIINATPVGMYPAMENSPLEARELNCRLVFDTIYRPHRTRLIELAQRRGIETVSGLEMFVWQGSAQWEIWTRGRAPIRVMRQAVIDALAREGTLVRKGSTRNPR